MSTCREISAYVPTEKTRAWLKVRNYDTAFDVASETFATWLHLPNKMEPSSVKIKRM